MFFVHFWSCFSSIYCLHACISGGVAGHGFTGWTFKVAHMALLGEHRGYFLTLFLMLWHLWWLWLLS